MSPSGTMAVDSSVINYMSSSLSANLRVLFVTNNAYLRSTSCSLDAVLGELRPLGLEPTLLFREVGPWQEQLAAAGISCHFDSLAPLEVRRPFESWRRVRRLVKLVRREHIDLIHCNEHDHYPLMRLVARWSGRPILVHVRFKIDQQFSDWAFGPPHVPDAVQFTSRALSDACEPVLPAALPGHCRHVVLNGRDLAPIVTAAVDPVAVRQNWGVPSDAVVVGTASSIRPHKKLEGFVHVVDQLRRHNDRVHGVIAGGPPFADDDYVTKLREDIARRGLERQMHLIGNINPVSPFLHSIDLFVSTSQWETFGMSICEAMACGKPALAFEAGGVSEVIHDPDLIIANRDSEALVARLRQLVDNESLRTAVGREASNHVHTLYDAPAQAARQVRVYEEVLGRRLPQFGGQEVVH